MNGRQDQDSWIVSKRNEINNLLVYHYLEEIKNDEIEKQNQNIGSPEKEQQMLR